MPPGADSITTRVCVAADDCRDEAFAYVTSSSETATGAARTPGLSDVARFLVGEPSVTVEPGAWTVAGAETNFVASGAGERTESGELLGQPVTVRFAPAAYHWSYGDGATRTTAVPGASWQASDLAAFAKTATSHAFAERGTYLVSVRVDFTARYRFAGAAWRTIPGTLGLTSQPVSVTVKSVTTVLVGHSCDERPAGPGCAS